MSEPDKRSATTHQWMRHSILLSCLFEKEYFSFETLWICF